MKVKGLISAIANKYSYICITGFSSATRLSDSSGWNS